jgi:hypothetical protein
MGPWHTNAGKQGLIYGAGAPAETDGAERICMNILPMSGERAKEHFHRGRDHLAVGDIARFLGPRAGARIRAEHGVVAEHQGQTAAANMLDLNRPFTAPPFLWTKHFDFSIRWACGGLG